MITSFIGGRKELVDDPESLVFNRVVGMKSHPQVTAGRLDQRRISRAAVASDRFRISERSVEYLQIVVGAVFRFLDVEFVAETESYSVIRRS